MMLQCSTTKALHGSLQHSIHIPNIRSTSFEKKVVKSTQHPTKISMRMLSLFFSELEFRDYHAAALLATVDRHKHVVSWQMHTVYSLIFKLFFGFNLTNFAQMGEKG